MSFGIFKNTKQYNWQYLYYFEMELFFVLDAQRTLIQYQETKLDEITKELTKKIEFEINNIETNLISSNYNSNIILDERLNSVLFIHHRYSSLIGIFSILESNLKTICEELIKQKKTSKKIKQYYSQKKGYLQCYWDFLNAVYEFRNAKLFKSFNYIKNRKNLRNIITHSNGIANNSQISEFQSLDYISIIKESKQVIIVKHLFLSDLMDEIDLFFRILLAEIDKLE